MPELTPAQLNEVKTHMQKSNTVVLRSHSIIAATVEKCSRTELKPLEFPVLNPLNEFSSG